VENKSQRIIEIVDDEYFKTEGAYYERCEGQMEYHHGTEGFVGFVPVPAIVKYLEFNGKIQYIHCCQQCFSLFTHLIILMWYKTICRTLFSISSGSSLMTLSKRRISLRQYLN
jgi:hypothetical protein